MPLRNTIKSVSLIGILFPIIVTIFNMSIFIWGLHLVSVSAPGEFRWSQAETIVSLVHFGSALILSIGLLLLLMRSYASRSRLFYIMPVVFFAVAQLVAYLEILTPRIRMGSPYVSLSIDALIWQPPAWAIIGAAVGLLVALAKYRFTTERG